MTYINWLLSMKGNRGPIGDLADDVVADLADGSVIRKRKDLLARLAANGASQSCYVAEERAHEAFKLLKAYLRAIS